jgi:hypothetical protein
MSNDEILMTNEFPNERMTQPWSIVDLVTVSSFGLGNWTFLRRCVRCQWRAEKGADTLGGMLFTPRIL